MKKLILISALIFQFLSTSYAQNKTIALSDVKYDILNNKKSKGILKGKIINASLEELKAINIVYTFVNLLGPYQTTFHTKASEDGMFFIEQTQNLPYQQVWLSFGNYVFTSVYLQNELEITFDLAKLKQKSVSMIGNGLTFKGKDGELNTIMNEYLKFNNQNNPNFHISLRELEEENKNYISKLDSLFSIQYNIDQEFFKKQGDTHKLLIDANTKAKYYSHLVKYYLNNRIKIDNIKDCLTPIYAISNETVNYISNLRRYTHGVLYPDYKTWKDYNRVFNFVDTTYDLNFNEIIKLNFEDKDVTTQNNIYKEALSSAKSNWAKTLLQQEIDNLNKKEKEIKDLLTINLAAKESNLGTLTKSLPFHADLYLNNSNSGKEILQNIKASFPNKLIILDIWATWCEPCLSQMPASKRLHELVKEKNLPVEFVYLCTDRSSDVSKWENKIAELQQPGTHLFASDKNIADLFQLFNRSGFPTYVAIKPNGEIDTKSISCISHLKIEDLKKMLE